MTLDEMFSCSDYSFYYSSVCSIGEKLEKMISHYMDNDNVRNKERFMCLICDTHRTLYVLEEFFKTCFLEEKQ